MGTPAQLREYLTRYEAAGVDQIIFVLQTGRNKHEHVMESLELFGKEVLPEFKDRDAAHVKAKQERLAPAIEAAMARRVDDAPPMPEGYEITPMARTMMDKNFGPKLVEKLQQASATGERGDVMEMFNQRQKKAQQKSKSD